MGIKERLDICFMGGSQAGVVGALTLLASGNKVKACVSYFNELTLLMKRLNIPVYKSVHDKGFMKELKGSDLLVSVHGREILGPAHLNAPRFGCLNLHPYLYAYKGASPVERALRDKNYRASVGAHMMSEKLDEGKVLAEEFVDVSGTRTADEIYNRLYPHYSMVLLKALAAVNRRRK